MLHYTKDAFIQNYSTKESFGNLMGRVGVEPTVTRRPSDLQSDAFADSLPTHEQHRSGTIRTFQP